MGSAIDSYKRSIDVTLHSPVLIIAATVIALLAGITGAILGFIPVLGSLLSQGLIAAVMAGVVGMVARAEVNNTSHSLADYTTTVKESGLSVFGAVIIQQLIFLVIALVFVIPIFLFGLVSAFAPAGAGQTGTIWTSLLSNIGAIGVVPILIIGVAIIFFTALGLVFQFLNVAIVIDDESAVSAFPRAVDFLRSNLMSVIGYSLLRVVTVFALTGGLFALITAGSLASDIIGMIGVLGFIIIGPFALTFFYTYHTLYYLETTEK